MNSYGFSIYLYADISNSPIIIGDIRESLSESLLKDYFNMDKN